MVMLGLMIMLRYSSILKNVQVYRFGILIYIIFIMTIIVLQQRSGEYAWLLGVYMMAISNLFNRNKKN